jgi:1-acyl-sn-glycerol-3-phosphate acyltransferase
MAQALRSLYIWLVIAIGTTLMYPIGLPLFLLTWPFDRTRRIGHWYAQVWGRGILKLNPMWSTEILGHPIPQDRPMVVVANHQGMGDILLAFRLPLHFKWISKAANFYVPFMGWFMYHAGYIPLVRGRRSSIERCMTKADDYLKLGVSVLFFPEGTRSKDGEVKPFKSGAFKLAVAGGYDILPLGIVGTAEALPKGTWRFSNERADMKIVVGEPISTKGLGEHDVEALIAQTREAIIALKEAGEGRARRALLRAVG